MSSEHPCNTGRVSDIQIASPFLYPSTLSSATRRVRTGSDPPAMRTHPASKASKLYAAKATSNGVPPDGNHAQLCDDRPKKLRRNGCARTLLTRLAINESCIMPDENASVQIQTRDRLARLGVICMLLLALMSRSCC